MSKQLATRRGNYAFYDHKPNQENMADEVLRGLVAAPKSISPKYFYDAVGSGLFEQITELEEYYVTRTEMHLFDLYLPQIVEHLTDKICLIEYGSGSSKKIRKVLDTLTPQAYVPVDISHQHLQENARRLHADFSHLDVYPVCADITQPFRLPEEVDELTKVAFFPGSSIGNFDPADARKFLANVHDAVGVGGAMILGVDRKKDISVLEAAYNDARGITAQFNLNVLSHLNQALGANFDLDNYTHVARYDADKGCIQMFLHAQLAQQVEIAGKTIGIAQGEKLHTENSYKYHPQEVAKLAANSGFKVEAEYHDANEWFGLYLLRAQ